MNSYLSLVPISARVHKRQSRMTRICIILAVFLATSIFSMVELWSKGQTEAMRQKHGDWHIALQGLPDETAEQVRSDAVLAVSAWYSAINTDTAHLDEGYTLGGRTAAIFGVEAAYPDNIMKYPVEGTFPQNEGEAALSADAKELFGLAVGDRVTLHTPAGDFDYTISGFYEDDEDFNRLLGGVCVYLNRAAFGQLCSRNGIAEDSVLCLRFASECGLKKTIADFRQQYGLTGKNVTENTAVLGLLGASTSKTMASFYPLAIGCFVIILFSGVFMISSCMNSNVAQRTQFFGMMRCIGASKQQIIHFVQLEALNWCKTAMLDDAKRSVASGDLSKVYGDSGYALAIFSDATRLNVGDSVTVNGQTLEIACVLSEGIGSISGAPVIVCSGETFTRLTGETHYMLLNVLAEKDISDAAVQKLYALAGDAAVSDNRELQSEVNGSYWVFRLAAYGFLAIISLITVLNIVNSISMGVSARTRQYGAMRAVGMEGRQITRMIAAEAVTYAACGTVTGLVLGLALHHLIYAKIVITHFGGVWRVPTESIALVVLLVAVSCVLAVHGPAKRIRNMPITATINEL